MVIVGIVGRPAFCPRLNPGLLKENAGRIRGPSQSAAERVSDEEVTDRSFSVADPIAGSLKLGWRQYFALFQPAAKNPDADRQCVRPQSLRLPRRSAIGH